MTTEYLISVVLVLLLGIGYAFIRSKLDKGAQEFVDGLFTDAIAEGEVYRKTQLNLEKMSQGKDIETLDSWGKTKAIANVGAIEMATNIVTAGVATAKGKKMLKRLGVKVGTKLALTLLEKKLHFVKKFGMNFDVGKAIKLFTD